jgi:hypothetical protein
MEIDLPMVQAAHAFCAPPSCTPLQARNRSAGGETLSQHGHSDSHADRHHGRSDQPDGRWRHGCDLHGGAPRVQWQVSTDGGAKFHNIPLATTDSLTFTAKPGQNGDEFQAVFTDPGEKAVTTDATLTVDFGPSVTHQPRSQTVATGSQVTLTADASGNPAPTVQWYTSIDQGKDWTAITGATSDSYTFTASSTPGSALYYALFSSTLGTARSNVAKVTAVVAPMVTSSPMSQVVAGGTVVTFTASAIGTPAQTVQWQTSTDDGKTWHNIPFATTDELTFTVRSSQNGDEFRAVFTDDGLQATTISATLTVPAVDPVV